MFTVDRDQRNTLETHKTSLSNEFVCFGTIVQLSYSKCSLVIREARGHGEIERVTQSPVLCPQRVEVRCLEDLDRKSE